jgi:GDPmannose 4,6-dehydratase
MMEAVKQFSPGARVFITGSGLQFVNTGKPIKETDAFDAGSAYSMSRIQSVYTARYYRSLGISTYVGYLFHHESPLRKEHHLSKLIAEAAKRIMHGSDEKITIGDTSVKKEWAYAEDISEGIFSLVSQDKIYEATIGTGLIYSIEDWLDSCFKIAGKNWRDYTILQDHNFKAEYPVLVSDPSTMHSIGWTAKTSFEELAHIMMQ